MEVWGVLWDTDNVCDFFKSPSFEQAKCDALDLLIEWETQEMSEWNNLQPTQEQIERWDYMIDNCSVEVIRYYKPNIDDCEEVWEPTQADLDRVGWKYWDQIKKDLKIE